MLFYRSANGCLRSDELLNSLSARLTLLTQDQGWRNLRKLAFLLNIWYHDLWGSIECCVTLSELSRVERCWICDECSAVNPKLSFFIAWSRVIDISLRCLISRLIPKVKKRRCLSHLSNLCLRTESDGLAWVYINLMNHALIRPYLHCWDATWNGRVLQNDCVRVYLLMLSDNDNRYCRGYSMRHIGLLIRFGSYSQRQW